MTEKITASSDVCRPTVTVIRDSRPDSSGIEWELKPRIIRNGPSIIVVGPDGVGKTTIVGHMSRLTGIPSFKCPSEKSIFKSNGLGSLAFDHMLTNFLSQTGYRFLSDRGYVCEWVYSKVFGRERDHDRLMEIDAAHSAIGTVIVYLFSSKTPTEPDDLVPPDRYWEVKECYDEFFERWCRCDWVSVDTVEMLDAYRLGGDRSEEFARSLIHAIECSGVVLK